MPQKNRWTRLVDSAQRRIVVEQPRTLNGAAIDEVRFEIQGLFVKDGQREEMTHYYEMHDRGVEHALCDKLSIWDRLRRQPAAAGTQKEADDKAVMTLWTPKPFVQLVFHLDDDDESVLYQECRFMVLSAGYFLKKLS